MSETLTRPPGRTSKNDLRRHALALVLFVVLVWYTVLSPSYTAAPLRSVGDETPDAEEREAETLVARGPVRPRFAPPPAPPPDEFETGEEEELDWPEIIGND